MSNQAEDKTLNLFPIDYPFETLVARMATNPAKLKLDPDFQRKYKWDKEGWGRASKFIESCLMRIPLPSCYFAEDEDGRHLVIDGVQRLTTISKFFNNEFRLEGMTTFKDLDGKFFSEIGQYQTELEATTIRCIVLRKENPKSLIREIFSRLNQGAVRLSDQEIRHALYPGTLDNLLSELGSIEIISNFGLADDSKKKRDGLEPEEQVLRFFAFLDDPDLEGFQSLKGFLDDYMEKNAQAGIEKISQLRERFNNAIDVCVKVFKEDVFTNPIAERRRKGLIHYDLLMTTVGLIDSYKAIEKSESIKQAYRELCESDEFKKTKSGGLQNKSSILRRRKEWNSLLKKANCGI